MISTEPAIGRGCQIVTHVSSAQKSCGSNVGKPSGIASSTRVSAIHCLLIGPLVTLSLAALPLGASEIQVAPQAVNFFGTTTGVIQPVATYTVGGTTYQNTTD